MGMEIHFKIQKIDQIIPVFWKFLGKLDKMVYQGIFFFRIFFEKMEESFANSVGRQKSWNVVSKLKFGKNFQIKTQTRTYLYVSYIFSHFFSISWKSPKKDVGSFRSQRNIGRMSTTQRNF